MRKTLILIFFCGLIVYCTKEKRDIRLSDLQTPIITGFELKDYYNASMGIIEFQIIS